MNDELQELRDAGYKPAVVGPQPFSFDDLLQNVDPAPDEETERLVASIYEDRRRAAHRPSLARYFEDEARFVEAVKRGEDALERGEYLTHEDVGRCLGRFLDP
jgi:predicted transcriptional regulator